MQAQDPAGAKTQATSQARRVDEICDRFEAAWKAGKRPALEDYLEEASGPQKPVLLRELLAVEIEHRRRRGERPAARDYRERLPAWRRLVEHVFAAETWILPVGPEQEVNSESQAVIQRVEPAGLDAPGIRDPEAPLPYGDFELLRPLGEGGMGTVFEARQRSLEKRVAVKVLKSLGPPAPAAVARFLREARAVAQLKHPGIVDVHGIGRTPQGGYFLVMDLVDGMDLEARVRDGEVGLEEAARIVAAVAEAVQHAHEHGIVHRDLKPRNVLLDRRGSPFLTDFGLAKLLQGDMAQLSHSGTIVGTPEYMAPEQIDARLGEVGPRTDVYGLGGVLHALLAGRAPFPGTTLSEVFAQVLHDPPPAPSLARPEVPPELEAVCLRCLEKEPSRRYAAASDVAAALRAWLAGRERGS